MTQDQVMGMLRQVLPILGGIAVALGWFRPEEVETITATILAITGPAFVIGGVVWSLIANNKTSIVKSASQMPEVLAMTINDPAMASAAKEAEPATRITTGAVQS